MMNRTRWMGIAAAVLAAPLALMVVAPVSTAHPSGGSTGANAVANPPPGPRGSQTVTFVFNRPSSVQRYYIQCADATRLDIELADGGIAGDVWSGKVKSWDAKPNEAACTSAGGFSFGGIARVFIYTANFGDGLNVLVEVRYNQGINDFSAAGSLRVTTNNTCVATITDLGQTEEI